MKKIIEGKVYNTETAKRVASFGVTHETLYHTKGGRWFLEVSCSREVRHPQMRYIAPMTEAEARRWAKEHNIPESMIKEIV